MLISVVNEILGDHNVDKQMTDSRGDVKLYPASARSLHADETQVAYLMADISDVSGSLVKELYQSLESLSCEKG